MSLDALCGLFGFTRQALWKQDHATFAEEIDNTAIVSEVRLIREDLPRCGVRKLQVILNERGHVISRDRLFNILRDSGMLVQRRHYRIVTTYSKHWMKKWSNLIRDTVPSHPDEIWVSDITYVEIVKDGKKEFLYLSLITDAYTHEIMGYALHGSLDTEGPLRALTMATASRSAKSLKGLIHHSDRGCQYCSAEYVRKLQENGMLISMTENGDPYENAIAERLNGILKTEWLYGMKLTTREQASTVIDRIVHLYNNVRPHESVGNLTPAAARVASDAPKKLWKNYWQAKVRRQQQAGEESLSAELPADGLTVATAPAYAQLR